MESGRAGRLLSTDQLRPVSALPPPQSNLTLPLHLSPDAIRRINRSFGNCPCNRILPLKEWPKQGNHELLRRPSLRPRHYGNTSPPITSSDWNKSRKKLPKARMASRGRRNGRQLSSANWTFHLSYDVSYHQQSRRPDIIAFSGSFKASVLVPPRTS